MAVTMVGFEESKEYWCFCIQLTLGVWGRGGQMKQVEHKFYF